MQIRRKYAKHSIHCCSVVFRHTFYFSSILFKFKFSSMFKKKGIKNWLTTHIYVTVVAVLFTDIYLQTNGHCFIEIYCFVFIINLFLFFYFLFFIIIIHVLLITCQIQFRLVSILFITSSVY